MPKPRFPLLARVVVALAAMGLLPLAISYYQLRTNKEALTDQVGSSLAVASLAAATSVDAYLGGLLTLARSTASHPLLLSKPRSVAAQELLRGTLVARRSIVLAGVFSPAGETVVMVRRNDMKEELGTSYDAEVDDRRTVSIVRGATRRWLRLRVPLPRDAGHLVLLADAETLDDRVRVFQLDELVLALASRDGDMVFGGTGTLDAFPAGAVEQATTGKLASGRSEYSPGGTDEEGLEPGTGGVIVGQAQLENAPWFVLSRQPARVAKIARQRIRRATWVSALLTIILAMVLSGGAYLTIVRPIRRLAAAQSRLAGDQATATGGSEIDQLEASFELLQQRVHDSEDLGQVFLGRYQVTGLLGSGAMGSVFRGRDPKLKRDLALKTVRVNAEDIDQQKLIASLLAEAAISARFHHPNIVTVYDVAEQGSAAFIAMELVDGTDLESYLSRESPLDADQVIPLGAAVARALAVAHQHDLVHHDVKPANVLLGHDRSIKVTDFGISELISAATRSDDIICGTPGYIAPECFLGDPYTPRADLFGLGLILFEALVGRHPFQGRTLRETILNTATLDPTPIESFWGDVPAALAELTLTLMAKEPAFRPASAAAVADQLEDMARARNLKWAPAPFDPARSPEVAAMAAGQTRLITVSENR